jgi:hypothetical protein
MHVLQGIQEGSVRRDFDTSIEIERMVRWQIREKGHINKIRSLGIFH